MTMKQNIKANATVQAVAAAILFILCSFFVGVLPDQTLSFTRYAFHTDLSGIMRPLSIGGFIVGLLVASLGWRLLSLIMAGIYNGRIEDGVIGHVSGFLIDEKSWAIRELVVETGHWYAGKEILISTGKVERISYEESKVFVHRTKAEIERAAENDVAKAGVRLL